MKEEPKEIRFNVFTIIYLISNNLIKEELRNHSLQHYYDFHGYGMLQGSRFQI